jgi:hypothetical protein
MSEVKPDWDSPYFYQEAVILPVGSPPEPVRGQVSKSREVGGGFENK